MSLDLRKTDPSQTDAANQPPTIGVGRVRGRRRVTMMDVARAANCSQSTVSFVLNNNRSVQISEATRNRVWEVARELGYQGATTPNGEAQPATGDRVIAFLVDSMSTSWETAVALEGVRQAAHVRGMIVLVAETQNDPRLEPRTLSAMLARRVEAVLYACVHTRKVVLSDALQGAGVPVILLNCYTDNDAYRAVVPSEIAGGQRATRYLIDAGHTRIATITGEAYMEAANARLDGYRRALAEADIPLDSNLVKEGNWTASSGYYATRELLERDRHPTAIFCQNDRMAIGAYEALKEAGLVIPYDISVIGYDDEEISRHLMPQLTTLVLPQRAMGRWAIEQLDDMTTNPLTSPRLTRLECELVERDSVAPPKGKRDDEGGI